MRPALFAFLLFVAAASTLSLTGATASAASGEGTVTITRPDGTVFVASDDDKTITSDDGKVRITPASGIVTITSNDGKVIITEEVDVPSSVVSDDGTVRIVAEGSEASESANEITLYGESQTPPAPPPSPVRANAVEDYLASRQDQGSDDDPSGTRLFAFDFPAEGLELMEDGRFRVHVYLLFADEAGRIVESRNETLIFAESNEGWALDAREPSGSISWNTDALAGAATSLGADDAFLEAEAHLRDLCAGGNHANAYSIADISRGRDGRVTVDCIRYKAEPGHRGFRTIRQPLIFSRHRGILRLESN